MFQSFRRPIVDHTRGAVLAIVVLTVSGCANYAQFQTAETVGGGEFRQGVGATLTVYEVDLGGTEDNVTVPAANWWGRFGITDEFELHANVWIPLGASLGGKYHLIGADQPTGFDLSLGLDIGALQLSSGSGANEAEVTIVDFYVPVYFGYRVSEAVAFYASPKYILRTAFGDGSGVGHLAGGTVGAAFGSNVEFYVEGAVFYDIEVEAPAFNVGIGVLL